jgi:uncharacterized protein (TIGR00369 family)
MDGNDAQGAWKDQPVTEGEWAGWNTYGADPFEDLTGPFYYRRDEAGQLVSAFKAEKKHMNGGGFMHGGCFMTFADYALFIIAKDAPDGAGAVTASFNGEFVDAAREGEIVEARGEVVRGGASLIFIRGTMTAAGRPVFVFSAILKRIRHKQAS